MQLCHWLPALVQNWEGRHHTPVTFGGEFLYKTSLYGVCVSEATICRVLKRHGITRKKARLVAQQRSQER